jgi:hypothetical protein
MDGATRLQNATEQAGSLVRSIPESHPRGERHRVSSVGASTRDGGDIKAHAIIRQLIRSHLK